MKEVDISSLVISRSKPVAKNTQTDNEGDKENHSISSQIPNQRIMESYRENHQKFGLKKKKINEASSMSLKT